MLSNQEQVYQIDDVSNQPFEILWQNLKKIFDHKGKFIVYQMVCKLNFGVCVCVWLSLSLNHTDLILPINVVFGYQANLSNEYAGCLSVWHARNISLYVCVSMLIPCEECESIHFECSPTRCHLIRPHTHIRKFACTNWRAKVKNFGYYRLYSVCDVFYALDLSV